LKKKKIDPEDITICPFCDGSGYDKKGQCTFCHGTGQITTSSQKDCEDPQPSD
jgi:DnaJ-class molecular chaperone